MPDILNITETSKWDTMWNALTGENAGDALLTGHVSIFLAGRPT